MKVMGRNVGIIGAGIVGLSTALSIQQTIPDTHITVIADTFTNLTSHGAAGLVRPDLSLLDGVPAELAREWVSNSWTHFDKLLFSEHAAEAGVSIVSGYHFWDTGKANKRLPLLIEEFSYNFHHCQEKELNMFPGKRYDHGVFFTIHQIETGRYLPWLTDKIKSNGGQIIERKINKFDELIGEFDVVVNCTGLRSLQLQADPLMTANRGQMFLLKAPWIRHTVFTDSDTWIVPCFDKVIVGGTRQDDFNDDVRREDADAMWARALKVMPSLKNAEVKKIWTGLRPKRKPVRVETELLPTSAGTLKMVHNYGHGGMGIALSWGTAVFATQLVHDLLDETNTPKSKL